MIFRNILLTVTLVASMYSAKAQYSWEALPVSGGLFLRGIDFNDLQNGMIGGDSGQLWKTSDNGNSWVNIGGNTVFPEFYGFNETNWMYAIYYKDLSNIMVASNTGIVYTTSDGGSTWDLKYSSQQFANSTNINNAGSRVLLNVDDHVLFTDDFGATWDSSNVALSQLSTINFVNDTVGFVCGSTGVAKTTDAGESWTVLPNIPPGSYLASYGLAENKVVVVGDSGTIVYTEDEGATWETPSSGTTEMLYDIDFGSSTSGAACGANGIVVSSLNGDLDTWTVSTTPNTNDLYNIYLSSNYQGFTFGGGAEVLRSPLDTVDLDVITYDGEVTVCLGDSVDMLITFANFGGSPAVNPQFTVWLNGGPAYSGNVTWNGTLNPGDTVTATFPPLVLGLGTNSFSMISTDQYNTTNNVLLFEIFVVEPNPHTVSGPHDFCPGDTVSIEATSGLSYSWDGLGGGQLNGQVDVYPTVDMIYPVEIQQSICLVIDTVYAYLLPDCIEIDSIPPNNETAYAFSPNGDNVNDVLVLDFLDDSTNIVGIYNRWGDLLVEYTDYNNEDVVWDGTFNNQIVPGGTYYFLVESESLGSQTGWVQVVR